jgi:hypothetical protein
LSSRLLDELAPPIANILREADFILTRIDLRTLGKHLQAEQIAMKDKPFDAEQEPRVSMT